MSQGPLEPNAFIDMSVGELQDALLHLDLPKAENETASVVVYFLLLLPDLLLVPTTKEDGQGYEFLSFPDDSLVWAVHDDPLSEGQFEPDRPNAAVHIAHNFMEHSAPLDALSALLRLTPDAWSWWEGKAPDLPEGRIIESDSLSSVLSVRVWNADAWERWNRDARTYLDECLDQAVAAVQDLQRAVSLASKESVRLLTAPDLPPVIPFSAMETGVNVDAELAGSLLFNLESVELRHFQTKPEIQNEPLMAALHAMEAGNPFLPVDDLLREAIASVKVGSYWSALVQAAASAELLIHIMAHMLRWEEGVAPETVGASLSQGGSSILAYASNHVGGRIGGNWDGTQQGPVGDWALHLINVRNTALHGAAPVTKEQARKGVDTAINLSSFIKDRLTERRVLAYPLTAAAFLGELGLRARKRWTAGVEGALDEVPNFAKRFDLWRRMLDAVPPPAGGFHQDDAILTAVVAPAWSDVTWVAHARDRNWAVPARLTQPLPLHLQVSLHETRMRDRQARGTQCDAPASMAFPGLKTWESTGEWRLAYHLVPTHACLRQGNDLDLSH